jgi:DNA polymerase-1
MSEKNKKLILIDAQAVLHRAWHALPKLTDPKGRVVNAVYGFTSLLLKLIHEQKPDYLAVAFDTKAPTFRHKKYKEYKAGREKQPQEFYDQIPLTKQILQSFDIPIFTLDGYEADDLIAAIIKEQKQKNIELKSLIVTGDLDLLQLVDQQTSVYFLRQGLNQIKIYGPDDVRERFDLEPKQLIDFKALRGDASDNIKGVPGIGEKNALDLIKKFKNLENIYAHIESKEKQESIKPTIIKILKENKKQAILSKELVTIKQEISGLNSEKLKPLNKMNYEKISNTLKEFGFKSLMKRMGDFNLANQTTLF